ncbi:hypothetical protein STEG23_008135, partial [Scotinomys teguina]
LCSPEVDGFRQMSGGFKFPSRLGTTGVYTCHACVEFTQRSSTNRGFVCFKFTLVCPFEELSIQKKMVRALVWQQCDSQWQLSGGSLDMGGHL